MKKLLAIAACMIIGIFCMTSCGSGDGGNKTDTGETTAPKATSIVGDWICSNASIEESGEKISGKELEELYGMKMKDMMYMSAYDDGTAEMTFFKDTAPITWIEKDKGYELTIPNEAGEAESEMNAVLKDGNLTITVIETYSANGEEASMEMSFTMDYKGKSSKLINGYKLEPSGEAAREMSIFINGGYYIVSDGVLYGLFNGNDFARTDFTTGDKSVEFSDGKVIKEDYALNYLCQDEKNIYGCLNVYDEFEGNGIVRVEKGSDKPKTIYDKKCEYLQIKGDTLYFTDENHYFCSMKTDGKNKKTILEKATYYPYFLDKNWLIYQDDADGESLHMYNMKSGEDTKLTSEITYDPIVSGEYLYYMTPPSSGTSEEYSFKRMSLFSGKTDIAEGDYTGFFIDIKGIYFEEGDAPFVKGMENWDQLYNQAFMGFVEKPLYKDDEIIVYSRGGGDQACFAVDDKGKENRVEMKVKK